ncbi:MAG: hypothetical protein WC959_07650 [Kiritimatiellales bacterium]
MISINQKSGRLTLKPLQTVDIPFTGSYIAILSNTSPSTDVAVRADTGATAQCKAGIGFPTVQLSPDRTTHIPAVFKVISFTNPSSTETITIEYLLSLGSVDDTRTVVQGWMQVDLSAPKIMTPPTRTVPQNNLLILEANQFIKERIITNIGDYDVWYGDENVNAAQMRGSPLPVGSSCVINCWGAICFQAADGDGLISMNNVLKFT